MRLAMIVYLAGPDSAESPTGWGLGTVGCMQLGAEDIGAAVTWRGLRRRTLRRVSRNVEAHRYPGGGADQAG